MGGSNLKQLGLTWYVPTASAHSINLLFPNPFSRISASQTRPDEATRLQQEDLDIKCLQLLRAIVHNEIVRLPEGWEDKPLSAKKWGLINTLKPEIDFTAFQNTMILANAVSIRVILVMLDEK